VVKTVGPTRRSFTIGAAAIAASFGVLRVPTARAAAATAADGTQLYYETTGRGAPIVFLHETSRTCRSFDLQIAALQDRYQCIVYNARGYPPSDAPGALGHYSEEIAATDLGAILDTLGLRRVHLAGVSMGAAVALQYALRNSPGVLSLTLCSIGAGSDLGPGEFAANVEATARRIEQSEGAKLADVLGSPPDRQRLKEKNPVEFQKFMEQAAMLSPIGLANAYRGVVKPRPPVYAHRSELAALDVPTLVVVGERDNPCLKPSRFLADTIPDARFEALPLTGHSVNVEEPATLNRLLGDFIDAATSSRPASRR
jgi:pimeloyl-ACP methyl ester carboxylesterase